MLVVLGVLAAVPAGALDPNLALTQYLRRSWSLVDGLPANAIAQVAQDRDGNLWLATAEGLVRFDGFEARVFDRANTPAMGFSETRSVVVDPQGDVWVAVAFSGVMRCHDGSCEALGPAGWDFREVVVDRRGVVWAFNQGVWRFPGGHAEQLTKIDAAVPYPSSLTFDDAGGMWLGGDRGEVVLADPDDGHVLGQWRAPQWRGGGVRVQIEPDGGLRVLTEDRVLRCPKSEPDRCSVLLEASRITHSLRDRDGNLWVATQGGEGLLRQGSDGTISRLPAESLGGRRLIRILEDREGNLWIATWDGGLVRLVAGAFATFGTPEGLPIEAVRVVTEDAAGTLWAGSDAGLIERRGNTWHRWAMPPAVQPDQPGWVISLAAAPDGGLLAGTLGGLLERRGRRLDRIPLGPTAAGVWALHAEADGTLWAGGGLPVASWRLPAARPGQPRAAAERISDLRELAYDFARDQAGRMWVATRGGAFREDERGQLLPIPLPTALGRDVLFSVAVDRRGDVWLGGLDRGLTRVRPDGSAHTLTTRDGLVNDSVHSLLEDDLGFLWVSSAKGVYRFAPADVDRYLAGTLPQLPTLVFDESDGLRTRSTSGGSQPAGWKTSDGRLWFATTRGLSVVDPRRLPSLEPPPVRITGLRADDQDLASGHPLSLAAGRHRLEVRWTAVHLQAPEKLRFRYRLREQGERWTEVANRHDLEIAALGPGQHHLEIAASLDDQRWGAPATVALAVLPFPWQRPELWALALLLAGAVVGAAFRWRLARAAQRERETRRELEALVAFGRGVTGLLDPEAIGRRLLAGVADRWAGVSTLVLAHREGREPLAAGTALGTLPPMLRETILGAISTLEGPLLLAERGRIDTEPGRTLQQVGLAAAVPIASGTTPLGLLALGPLPSRRAYSPRDLAHAAGLAAHVAAALEGAWQAQEALRWRELSEARREWSEQDLISRLVFAAVARGGFDGPITPSAVAVLLARAAGGEARIDPAAVAHAIDRLCASGVLERGGDDGLAIARLRWLLLPEVRQPLAELARGAVRTVGAYRLLERIGVGGMAEVFRAVNVHDGTAAAIKLLRPDEAREEESRRRLEREGELVASIRHPNLVRLLARGEHEGRLYLAMELLAGETLAARLRRGPLPPAEVLRVARDVASALAALHARQVMHRDVKPANVMAEPDGRYVLLDLGLARGLGATTLTQAESILGTLRYMSPESLRGEPLGPASDLWSLGVTLHELLTGGFPWSGTDTLQAALDLGRAVEPPQIPTGPTMPPTLAALLRRLLDPCLDRRYASANALLVDLDGLTADG